MFEFSSRLWLHTFKVYRFSSFYRMMQVYFLLLSSSVAALRNLSTLLQLGNNAEVRNYVALLSGILNRLSLDPRANAHVLAHTRNALISTMCGLESGEQVRRARQTQRRKLTAFIFKSIFITSFHPRHRWWTASTSSQSFHRSQIR